MWGAVVFRCFWKIAKSDYELRYVCLCVCLSIRLSAWNTSAPTGWIFVKFDVWVFFEKTSLASSYICHGVGPLVDPFRSHIFRSLFKGQPWFLLPVGEQRFITLDNFEKYTKKVQVSLWSDKNRRYFACRHIYIYDISLNS